MEASVLMGLKILYEVYVFFFPGDKSQMSAESLWVHCGRESQQLSELDAQGSDFQRSLESHSERAEGDLWPASERKDKSQETSQWMFLDTAFPCDFWLGVAVL